MWTQAFIPIEGLHSVMGKYRVEVGFFFKYVSENNEIDPYFIFISSSLIKLYSKKQCMLQIIAKISIVNVLF